MLAVLGAGAMGAALALQCARASVAPFLLATPFDGPVLEAHRRGGPHPALGVPLPAEIDFVDYDSWEDALGQAEFVIVAVSSSGMAPMVHRTVGWVRADALWAVATKGWDEETLRSPSEVVTAALGVSYPVAVLGGPALASELAVAAPTAMVCAAEDLDVARQIAALLESPTLSVAVTDDVHGVETAAAYKNVLAVAVGICEGLAESADGHALANARAALFALGLRDMARLSEARGGRAETIFGLAGAGDLYVTCLGGRNGRFGRLLGAGSTTEQAIESIGSTVEGVANTNVAITLAARLGIELPTARAVRAVIAGELSPRAAVDELLDVLRHA